MLNLLPLSGYGSNRNIHIGQFIVTSVEPSKTIEIYIHQNDMTSLCKKQKIKQKMNKMVHQNDKNSERDKMEVRD